VSLEVVFLAGADSDLQQIFNHFEDYKEGFGAEFLILVEGYLTRISTFPEIARWYCGGVRRQIMSAWPYGSFYKPAATRILIIAILDLRQDEQEIFRRIRS
jgi:plasmid stabilization system protein ParE